MVEPEQGDAGDFRASRSIQPLPPSVTAAHEAAAGHSLRHYPAPAAWIVVSHMFSYRRRPLEVPTASEKALGTGDDAQRYGIALLRASEAEAEIKKRTLISQRPSW